jgi:hypothetical protein
VLGIDFDSMYTTKGPTDVSDLVLDIDMELIIDNDSIPWDDSTEFSIFLEPGGTTIVEYWRDDDVLLLPASPYNRHMYWRYHYEITGTLYSLDGTPRSYGSETILDEELYTRVYSNRGEVMCDDIVTARPRGYYYVEDDDAMATMDNLFIVELALKPVANYTVRSESTALLFDTLNKQLTETEAKLKEVVRSIIKRGYYER